MSFTESAMDFAGTKAGKQTGDTLLKQLDEVSKNPENEAKLVNVMSKIDKSAPIKAFRENFWNKLPKIAQWGMMQSVGPGAASSPTINLLLKSGFITYKGHMDKEGNVDDKKIAKMGEFKKWVGAKAIKVGAWFIPELKPIAPFVDPLMKLDKVKGDVLTRVRGKLRDLREEVGKPGEANSEGEVASKDKKPETKTNLVATKQAPSNKPSQKLS